MPVVIANVARESRIMTDEQSGYRDVKRYFAGHGTTGHGRGEYVNLEDRGIHSNTVEGYFSIFKRGMKGIYQHCGEQHLHRYLAEFEFRYNNVRPTALPTACAVLRRCTALLARG